MRSNQLIVQLHKLTAMIDIMDYIEKGYSVVAMVGDTPDKDHILVVLEWCGN